MIIFNIFRCWDIILNLSVIAKDFSGQMQWKSLKKPSIARLLNAGRW